jgi:hypothetical protein
VVTTSTTTLVLCGRTVKQLDTFRLTPARQDIAVDCKQFAEVIASVPTARAPTGTAGGVHDQGFHTTHSEHWARSWSTSGCCGLRGTNFRWADLVSEDLKEERNSLAFNPTRNSHARQSTEFHGSGLLQSSPLPIPHIYRVNSTKPNACAAVRIRCHRQTYHPTLVP